MSTSIRQSIRAIVDTAHAAGKPITARIIWGLLSWDMPEDDFTQALHKMVRANELVLVKPPAGSSKGRMGRAPCTYEPGPQPAAGKKEPRTSALMGFREEGRLREAQEAAREWAKP